MKQSRFYSHLNKLNPIKSKSKSLQKNTSYTPQKYRSVIDVYHQKLDYTYNNNDDLLKLINDNENLLEIIEKTQNSRGQFQFHFTFDSKRGKKNIELVQKQAFILFNFYHKQKTQLYQEDRKYRKESIPYTFQLNPKNIAYYQENKIYGKFIEPTEYKKIDYESIKTLELALSKQLSQEFELQNQLNKIKERPLYEDQPQKQSIEQQMDINKNYNSQMTLDSDDYDTDVQHSQYLIIKSTIKPLKNKQKQIKLKQNQEQNHQQKLSFEFQIKDEFQKYLDVNYCHQSIQYIATNQNQYIKMPKNKKILRK